MLKFYLTIVVLFISLTTMAQDSTYIEYWKNLRIKRVVHYVNENNHMIKLTDSLFYTDGTLWEKRVYNPSSKTILLTRYDYYGKPELTIPLNENGNMEGLYTKHYSNGQRSEEGMYANGKREGIWKYWYASGKQEKEILFEKNFPFTETEWWENGNKRKEKDASETVILYHENGQKESVTTRSKEGQSYTRWDEQGRKREESTLIGYEIVLINAWDEKGKQIITNGTGYLDITDGELGLPMRIYYKKGKRVK
jgi:antitoxin component YwqK of YwqJK toxin-antitoxin module